MELPVGSVCGEVGLDTAAFSAEGLDTAAFSAEGLDTAAFSAGVWQLLETTPHFSNHVLLLPSLFIST